MDISIDRKASGQEGAVIGVHGATRLTAVEVDSYNAELKDKNGFIGDRVSKKPLYAILDKWRRLLRNSGADPFRKRASEKIGKKKLDEALTGDKRIAAGLVHCMVEEFAQELAFVIGTFLKTREWQHTEIIAVGGGMSGRQIGALVMGRAELLLKADNVDIALRPIHYEANDAGLIGAVHLAPPWIFRGHDAILAVDIGGTNMRAGVVRLNLKKAGDLSKAYVWKRQMWRHAETKAGRDDVIDELVGMLKRLIEASGRAKLLLAPFIGIGCPGKINSDGSIERGAQNLPGNWESARFNLPARLSEAIPQIAGEKTNVLMHNDAVVQGLSEVPFTRDLKCWAVLTLGTGLGNAHFINRKWGGRMIGDCSAPCPLSK